MFSNRPPQTAAPRAPLDLAFLAALKAREADALVEAMRGIRVMRYEDLRDSSATVRASK